MRTGINIDNMAHLGGFTCGLLFAAPHGAADWLAAQLFRDAAAHAVAMVVAAGAVWVLPGPVAGIRCWHRHAHARCTCAKIFSFAARLNPNPRRQTMEAPRIHQASCHYRRSRRIYQPAEREQARTPSNAHCPPHAGQDRRTAFHHRLRRNRGDESRNPARLRTLWPRPWTAASTTSTLRPATAMRRSGWGRRWRPTGTSAFWPARPKAA